MLPGMIDGERAMMRYFASTFSAKCAVSTKMLLCANLFLCFGRYVSRNDAAFSYARYY